MSASTVSTRHRSTQARARSCWIAIILAVVLVVITSPSASPAWAGTNMDIGPPSVHSRPHLEWPLRSANGDASPVINRFRVGEQRWSPGHRGIDLAGSPGQAVLSAAAGSVTFAGVVAGMPLVVVNHGSTRSTYQPVLASVQVGDTVAQGRAIGRLTSVGSHYLPQTCLHFGVIEGETYLDPALLMTWPIRLLTTSGEGKERQWFGGGLG